MKTKQKPQEVQKNAILHNYYKGCRPYVVGGLSYCISLIFIWVYYPKSLIYVISFSLVVSLLLCVYKIISLSRELSKKHLYIEDEKDEYDDFHPNDEI